MEKGNNMKSIIFAAALLLSISANAAPALTKVEHCIDVSQVFVQAVQMRAWHQSPQEAFKSIKYSPRSASDAEIKAIVNMLYFDPAMITANSGNQKEIIDSCMRDYKPQFQPLK